MCACVIELFGALHSDGTREPRAQRATLTLDVTGARGQKSCGGQGEETRPDGAERRPADAHGQASAVIHTVCPEGKFF